MNEWKQKLIFGIFIIALAVGSSLIVGAVIGNRTADGTSDLSAEIGRVGDDLLQLGLDSELRYDELGSVIAGIGTAVDKVGEGVDGLNGSIESLDEIADGVSDNYELAGEATPQIRRGLDIIEELRGEGGSPGSGE